MKPVAPEATVTVSVPLASTRPVAARPVTEPPTVKASGVQVTAMPVDGGSADGAAAAAHDAGRVRRLRLHGDGVAAARGQRGREGEAGRAGREARGVAAVGEHEAGGGQAGDAAADAVGGWRGWGVVLPSSRRGRSAIAPASTIAARLAQARGA